MANVEVNLKSKNGQHSISILTNTPVYDAQGNPAGVSRNHRTALGLGDFNGDVAQFIQAIELLMGEAFGMPVTQALANIHVAVDRTAELTDQLAQRDVIIENLRARIPPTQGGNPNAS